MSEHTNQHHHEPSYKIYFIVWIALLILTGITVYASFIDFGQLNVVIALVIASVKATLVALYFMHLKFEDSITWLFAAYPIILLLLLIGFTITDTFTRFF